MVRHLQFGSAVSLAGMLLLLGAAIAPSARGQATNPGSAPACNAGADKSACPSDSTGSKKSASGRFPFPGEQPAQPVQPTQPASVNQAPAPNAPAATRPDAPANKKFPFPGEAPSPAATPNGPGSSSSSSSSSSDSDAAPADSSASDKPADSQPPGRRLLHRVNPPGTKLQSPAEREAEDLSVAKFYMDKGDAQAAYLRSKDAVSLDPDDPAAHFALAEAASKLNKRNEAIEHYEALLKLDATDKQLKAARKALASLQASH